MTSRPWYRDKHNAVLWTVGAVLIATGCVACGSSPSTVPVSDQPDVVPAQEQPAASGDEEEVAPEVEEPSTVAVRFFALTSDSGGATSVSIGTPDGVSQHEFYGAEKTFTVQVESGSPVSMSAQLDGYGAVACGIGLTEDDLFVTNKSEGDYAVVSCNGIVP